MEPRARRRRGATPTSLTVLTGLSGAGKSHALRALEDLGYYCVDNLPLSLLPTLAQVATRTRSWSNVAIVVDVREAAFLREFPDRWRDLGHVPGLRTRLVFLEASDATLVRRFSETRRPHPLAHHRPVREGILEERASLERIRALADEVIDTTELTVHELRELFMAPRRPVTRPRPLQVTLLSFGFKFGLPIEADLVFDVRYLANPYFAASLRGQTGRDRGVIDYLEKRPETAASVRRYASLLRFLLPQYAREGKTYLTVAVGCTGGQHRSVYVAEALYRALSAVRGAALHVRHRDMTASSGERTGRRRP